MRRPACLVMKTLQQNELLCCSSTERSSPLDALVVSVHTPCVSWPVRTAEMLELNVCVASQAHFTVEVA